MFRVVMALGYGLMLSACGGINARSGSVEPESLVISLVGTNDLHGHVDALPVLGGYLRVLRDIRRSDGAVVLLDAGDMFQGTLESNLAEGLPIVEAYNRLGYDAVTVGNHDFDYGPVGQHATPQGAADDPRGALRALAARASYPFLNANLWMAEGRRRPDWGPNFMASVHVQKAGVDIGIIGVTTEDTLRTTIAANVDDLWVEPLVDAIVRESAALRARGADLVFVAAHAGGRCGEANDPEDFSSCDPQQEIFQVANALPSETVDAIVAGHTHRTVAHRVNGITIIESSSFGRAFGRVDFWLHPQTHRVQETRVFAPQALCASGRTSEGNCQPGYYESREVRMDQDLNNLAQRAIGAAEEIRQRELGVTLDVPVTRSRTTECALGNWLTDLMRRARPQAEVAITNGGGFRANLGAGVLRYGMLYEALPFDNRFAFVDMTGDELAQVLAENLQSDGSFLSISGLRVEARCTDAALVVSLFREDGSAVSGDVRLSIVTSDYLATGGNRALSAIAAEPGRLRVESEDTIRDAIAGVLTRHSGHVRADTLFSEAGRRVVYRGTRPVQCDAAAVSSSVD